MMNTRPFILTICCVLSGLTFALPSSVNAAADEQPGRSEQQALLEEAERARIEAEQAREEATRAAQRARELARESAALARQEASEPREEAGELRRRQTEEQARQREETERAREELSRAHRELREASREIARAHRALAENSADMAMMQHMNLGDRAVLGVVLGKESDAGVSIIGVSPDGPAERAGLQAGDVLVSIRGEDLAAESGSKGRETLFRVMDEVEDGETVAVVVDRNGESLKLEITAERREPSSWQTMIRIPEAPHASGAPGEPEITVEGIGIPHIDHEALEANVWFGLPYAQGLELAEVNEGLGADFETDRGVLVLKARSDNAYRLEAGDVVLDIDGRPVNSPADMIRALREIEPGSEIEFAIKRDHRDETLSIVMPENRLGFRNPGHPHTSKIKM